MDNVSALTLAKIMADVRQDTYQAINALANVVATAENPAFTSEQVEEKAEMYERAMRRLLKDTLPQEPAR